MARVSVDWDQCICAGMCLSAAPTVFDIDAEGKMVLLHGEELGPDEVEGVRDAVACCPAEALTLTS